MLQVVPTTLCGWEALALPVSLRVQNFPLVRHSGLGSHTPPSFPEVQAVQLESSEELEAFDQLCNGTVQFSHLGGHQNHV